MTSVQLASAVGVLVLWLISQRTQSSRLRQSLYLVASYVFYLLVGRQFFVVLLLSSLFNFWWGGVVRRRPISAMLWVGIGVNVALLSTFKYLPPIAQVFGSGLAGAIAHLALPLGISFWTFQGLSYLIDQYRGENLDPTLLEFLLYMGFAPTVLSGPIARVPELLPQLREATRASWEDIATGVQSVWVGVLMVTLARFLAGGTSGQGVNWGFDHLGDHAATADVWVLLVAYGFELFFDFAGYSRIVIGIARMFGIRLPENFRRPFLSATPSIFWTRWHMTLSFWIRDYLFLPMATMRREIWWRNAMLVFSMVIFGIWHKLSVLFLVWGVYHGLLLLAHRMIQQYQRRTGPATSRPWHPVASWFVTFMAITFGWILFRARDAAQATQVALVALVPSFAPSILPVSFYLLVAVIVAGYFAVEGLMALRNRNELAVSLFPLELRYVCYAGIFYFTVFHTAVPQSFIYFQF